ncbi:MAG: transketolase [Acidimicrobiaceae bacterium]|nr:transketolase [Acidimicrobiaceae bacterium]
MADSLYFGASDLEDRTIRQVVALAMDAPAAAQSGHSGTAMALAPLATMLFSRVLAHDPSDPSWPDRDRFVLSLGHASILQYAIAHSFGYDVSLDDLRGFRQAHSRTPGHPEVGVTPTVEVTTGPLGQGLANAVGLALAERILRTDFGEDLVSHRTFVIAGDGCLEEGVSHEAASLAGSLGLSSLVVFYDDNRITIDGATSLASVDDAAARFRAYGWHVVEAGEVANDLDALEAATREALSDPRPSLVVLRTHIGFPSPAMMDRREAHGTPFSGAQISEVKALLGVPDEPFVSSADIAQAQRARLAPRAELWRERLSAAGPRGERFLTQWATYGALSDEVDAPHYDGGNVATRKAMQAAMDAFAPHCAGLTAGSADLTDNTGVLLKHSVAQGVANPGGRQIYYGIREFAMGAALVGQSLHGGMRAAGSTFFVFSDYLRSSLRMASLSHAGALFVFTHDSVGVGEDGPTHQPVEHLAALRAIPGLHVHRPSDANETIQAVEAYLRSRHPEPTALILSRQDMPVLTGEDATASREGAPRGGYVLREREDARVTLVATGSEVGVVLDAADQLTDQGVSVRVVALPCWTCFERQEASYRRDVLRRDIPSLSLEAGATLGWHRYVDEPLGIDQFGMSAPGAYVFQHFGITAARVVEQVLHREEAS